MDEIEKISNDLKAKIEARKEALIAETADFLADEFRKRIFGRGEKTNGRPIGKYRSEAYKKRRIKRGLQVDYKDYYFTGELSRSLNVRLTARKTAVIEIIGQRATIARYLENADGQTFAVSNLERAKALRFATNKLKGIAIR